MLELIEQNVHDNAMETLVDYLVIEAYLTLITRGNRMLTFALLENWVLDNTQLNPCEFSTTLSF